MKLFVTGATGVIGRRLLPALRERGHQVQASARSPRQAERLTQAGVQPVAVSLFDRAALAAALSGTDAVLNLATHMPSSTLRMFLRRAWRENDELRRVAAAKLVEAALSAGVQRFIQESFALAYPDCGGAWIAEATPLEVVPYNRTLLDAERAAARFSGLGRVGVVLRFGSFYGPDARQLTDMVRLVRAGFAPLPGPAAAYMSSVAHDDAATAALAALELPAGVYNVCDDEPLTHRDYVDSLAAALGVSPPRLPPPWLRYLAGSLGEMLARSQRVSNGALRTLSPWRPRYASVREGWVHALRHAHSGSG